MCSSHIAKINLYSLAKHRSAIPLQNHSVKISSGLDANIAHQVLLSVAPRYMSFYLKIYELKRQAAYLSLKTTMMESSQL